MANISSVAKSVKSCIPAVDASCWYCAVVLLSIIVLSGGGCSNDDAIRWSNPCDEIYVVGEGETLHTISDKCGDPFIVERNPHIHDPDDVFPGLVIKIIPTP